MRDLLPKKINFKTSFPPLDTFPIILYIQNIMIDRVLIDTLNIRARDFTVKWVRKIRDIPEMKHYHKLTDEVLIEECKQIFPLLSNALDRGLNRSQVGSYFVNLGKQRLRGEFPVSEVIYALNAAQKVVIEYIMTEFAPENPMRMYQSLGALTTVSEFFLMGSLYIIKGFLEETYTKMSSHDKETLEMFRKYFRDDFFFKKE